MESLDPNFHVYNNSNFDFQNYLEDEFQIQQFQNDLDKLPNIYNQNGIISFITLWLKKHNYEFPVASKLLKMLATSTIENNFEGYLKENLSLEIFENQWLTNLLKITFPDKLLSDLDVLSLKAKLETFEISISEQIFKNIKGFGKLDDLEVFLEFTKKYSIKGEDLEFELQKPCNISELYKNLTKVVIINILSEQTSSAKDISTLSQKFFQLNDIGWKLDSLLSLITFLNYQNIDEFSSAIDVIIKHTISEDAKNTKEQTIKDIFEKIKSDDWFLELKKLVNDKIYNNQLGDRDINTLISELVKLNFDNQEVTKLIESGYFTSILNAIELKLENDSNIHPIKKAIKLISLRVPRFLLSAILWNKLNFIIFLILVFLTT